jgi:hypothetical protein
LKIIYIFSVVVILVTCNGKSAHQLTSYVSFSVS